MNRSYRSDSPALPASQESREPTVRERLVRAKTLARRSLGYWKMALLLFAIGAAIALVVAWNVKRIYKSECVVLFKPGIKADDSGESSADRASKMAPKLKEVLTTHSHLEPIINELHLYPQTVDSKGMLEAVDEMRLHVGFRGRDSDTFVISFDNEDADIAQKVTKRLADTMIDEFTSTNVTAAKQQAEFLAKESKHAEDELEKANTELATFLAAHPEFAAEAREANKGQGVPTMVGLPPGPGGVSDPQLGTLWRQKMRLEAEMKSANAAAVASGGAAPIVNLSVDGLTKARDEAAKAAAAAQADLADKRLHLTEEHPDVIAARQTSESAARALHVAEAKLAAAQAAAAGGGGAQPHGSDNPYEGTGGPDDMRQKIAALNAQIAARQAQIARPPSPSSSTTSAPVSALVALETDWQRLLRAMGDAKAKHDELQQKAERATLQASAVQSSGGDHMEVIDPAFKPVRPFKGGRTNAALLGLAVAFFVSLLYAAGRVVYSDTIIDAADIESLHIIPVIGVLPKIAGAGGAVAPVKGGHPVVD